MTTDICWTSGNILGGLGCVVMSWLGANATAIGALVVILSLAGQQYHNYRMRQQGNKRNQIIKDNKEDKDARDNK